MAGKMRLLPWVTAALAAGMARALAQDTAEQPKGPPATPEGKRPGWFGGALRRPGLNPDSPSFENVRKALEALTPEQRKRFQENFWRWSNLTAEEKKALADREAVRKRKIAEDIDAAIKETGLDLDPARRELFTKRYGEERRKIEEQLRKEMEEKRKPLVKEIVAKLKAEFSAGATEPAIAPATPDK
jgi:hypothetical protein